MIWLIIWWIIKILLMAFGALVAGIVALVLVIIAKEAMAYDPYGDRKPDKRNEKKVK